MESPGAFCTAMAALVISMASAALTFVEALQGPQIKALAMQNVFVFAAPADDPAARLLGAIARPEIAHTAAAYPDILLSQAIVVRGGDQERACLSARGQALFHSVGANEQPPVDMADAAELIPLNQMALEVRDVSSRAALPAGELYSVRQLFDQAATKSDVDPCHHYHRAVQEAPYTAAQFADAFRGQTVLLRYEARFDSNPGYLVDCSFDLSDTRADRLLSRGWINVPCSGAEATQIPDNRNLWERIQAAFDRLF